MRAPPPFSAFERRRTGSNGERRKRLRADPCGRRPAAEAVARPRASPAEAARAHADRAAADLHSGHLRRADRGHAVPFGRKRDRAGNTAADRGGAGGLGRRFRPTAGRKGLRRSSPGPARRGRRQSAYQARLPAQLRADGSRQPAAQDRAAGQEDGGGRRPRRAVRQDPQKLGRSGNLGHDQAVFERLHVGLFPQCRRCKARRNRHRGEARERTDLHLPVRAHADP